MKFRIIFVGVLLAELLILSAVQAQDQAKPSRGSGKAADAAKGGGSGVADGAKGKLVYQTVCAVCHTPGLAGAPKPTDAEAWAPRLRAGAGPVYANAIKGKGAMPPKGGNASLSDAEVRAAVDFMLAQARGGVVAPPAGASAPNPTEPSARAASKPPTMDTGPASGIAVAAATGPAAQEAQDPNAFNRLLGAPGRRNPPPTEDGIHDPESGGTALLQAPLAAFQLLPRSSQGNYVDWGAALDKKLIRPRWDTRDAKAEATVMDLTIIREVKGSMPDVAFPHKQHTEWLDCSACHPGIFVPQKGANQISMAAIMLGQKCGVCHGKVAFPVSECRLCHSRQKGTEARTAQAPSEGAGRR